MTSQVAVTKYKAFQLTVGTQDNPGGFYPKLEERAVKFGNMGTARETLETCCDLEALGHTTYGDKTIVELRTAAKETIEIGKAMLKELQEELLETKTTIKDFENTKDSSPAATNEECVKLSKMPALQFCQQNLTELRNIEKALTGLIERLKQRIGDCEGSLQLSSLRTLSWATTRASYANTTYIYQYEEGFSGSHACSDSFGKTVEKSKDLSIKALSDTNHDYDTIQFYIRLRKAGITEIKGTHIDTLVDQVAEKIETGKAAQEKHEALMTSVGGTLKTFKNVPGRGKQTEDTHRVQFEYAQDRTRLNVLYTLQSQGVVITPHFLKRIEKVGALYETYKTTYWEGGIPNISQARYDEAVVKDGQEREPLEAALADLEKQLENLRPPQEEEEALSVQENAAKPLDTPVTHLATLLSQMNVQTQVMGQRKETLTAEVEAAATEIKDAIEGILTEYAQIKQKAPETLAEIVRLKEDLALSEQTPASKEVVEDTFAASAKLIADEETALLALKPEDNDTHAKLLEKQTAALAIQEKISVAYQKLNEALTGVLSKHTEDKEKLVTQIDSATQKVMGATKRCQTAQEGINTLAEENIEGAKKASLIEDPNLSEFDTGSITAYEDLNSIFTGISTKVTQVENDATTLESKLEELKQKKSSQK